MAKFDLEVRGINAGVSRFRVAASATRSYAGEPVMTTPTYTTGTTNSNTVIRVSDNKPTVGTDDFVGVLAKDFEVTSAAVVTAHYTRVICPIPYCTRIRGQAETSANIDTQSELTGVLFDLTRFDNSTTTVYNIQAGGEADSGGLQIMDGSTTKYWLECVVDARAMRTDVTA